MARRKRVILFGAGASHGARSPQPPLGKCLHEYVGRYFSEKEKWDELKSVELRQELKQLIDAADSYELLANKLSKTGKKDLLAKLNFLMACALTPPINDDPKVDDAFIEKQDVYDEFLRRRIHNGEDLGNYSFITLNYDCLLERAICRSLFKGPTHTETRCLCQHVDYRLSEASCFGIEVLKPHGSINWGGDILWKDADKNNISISVSFDRTGRRSYKRIEVVPSPINKDYEGLVIAHYAPGKETQANRVELNVIQGLARKRISETDVIEIIGLHLPTNSSDDPFLSNLLSLMQKRVTEGACSIIFVNIDNDETYNARSSFGFKTRHGSFKDYVREQDAIVS